MSSGLSSDQIIKNQIINEVGWQIGDIELRIFPEGSNDDQIPFAKGGLTFGYNGVLYGSCDAVWYIDNKRFLDRYNNKFINQKPIIALEGTDALQRGSTGNAQYQRFHHALGAVKNGIIGIYYLKPGKDMIQYDLYGMAYFASQREKGYYLIVQNLSIVKEILELVDSFGLESQQVKNYIDNYLKFMYEQWYENKLIDEVVTTFEIKRSLSAKGCPYDNSPAETFNHILKTECIKGKKFGSLKELEIELMDYINWYNNHRLHGSLGYLTPMEYKEKQLSLNGSKDKISCEFASV
jgi:hypothetical protein